MHILGPIKKNSRVNNATAVDDTLPCPPALVYTKDMGIRIGDMILKCTHIHHKLSLDHAYASNSLFISAFNPVEKLSACRYRWVRV